MNNLNHATIEAFAADEYGRLSNDLTNSIEAYSKLAVPEGMPARKFDIRAFQEWLVLSGPPAHEDWPDERVAGYLIAVTGVIQEFMKDACGIAFKPNT